MKLAVFCFAAWAALGGISGARATERLGLKGISIGDIVRAEDLRQSLGFVAHDPNLGPGTGCALYDCGYGLTNIAGTNAEIHIAVDHDGHVLEINAKFDAEGFPGISAALHKKYGEPFWSGQEPKQTLMGAKFMMQLEIWRDKSGNELSVMNHIDALKGLLILRSKAVADADRKAAAKARSEI